MDAYLGLHIGEIQKISIRLAKKLPLLGGRYDTCVTVCMVDYSCKLYMHCHLLAEIQWCDAMKVLVATEDRFFFVCQLNQNHVTGGWNCFMFYSMLTNFFLSCSFVSLLPSCCYGYRDVVFKH